MPRKTFDIPPETWEGIKAFIKDEDIPCEAEAFRRLIRAGLKVVKQAQAGE